MATSTVPASVATAESDPKALLMAWAIRAAVVKSGLCSAIVRLLSSSRVKGRTPSGRWGKPEELVGAAVFLASDASTYVNGQLIYVDGGMTAIM